MSSAPSEMPTETAKVEADLTSELKGLVDLRQARIGMIKALQELRRSHVFVLWSWESLNYEDFYTLVDMLEDEAPEEDLDLIVFSQGGNGEAGYRIGHTFHEWAARRGKRLRVIIPLFAMSAATLLALGADEIVMGLTSQLGPIDPQVAITDRSGGVRHGHALALLDGLKVVSEHVENFANMRPILEEIIRDEHLSLVDLGLKERMRESGKQYAEILLTGGMIRDPTRARECAVKLTDFYKHHGHPIDVYEAERLGLKIRHSSGDEWKAIKRLREAYTGFVSQPGLLRGSLVSCAIETATLRMWRYTPLRDPSGATRLPGAMPSR